MEKSFFVCMLSPRYDAEGLRRPHDEETDVDRNSIDCIILSYLSGMHKYQGKEKFGREGGSEKQAAANAHLLSVSAV
ncbi:MAG: hypothetical protein II581_01635, partial [Oscillospiraceae bacterium]|nr:hypothetical protein [Oscillospiraceae bacterium]